MKTLEDIREAAMRLSLSERAALAEELFESISMMPGAREEDLRTLLTSRIAALEKGDEELIDGPTAMEEIRDVLRRRPKSA
jgi:putative addiction module component (TIGR02574 family)